MYGTLEPGEEVKVDEWVLELACTASHCTYKRYRGSKLERVAYLSRKDKVVVHPTIYTGMTDCIFVRFPMLFTLSPKTAIKVPIIYPIDVAVTVVGRITKTVDYLRKSKVKYALYGRPERGMVCRYLKQNLEGVPEEGEEIGLAMVSNVGNEIIDLGLLVFPRDLLNIYYLPKSDNVFISPLIVVIKEGLVEVRASKARPSFNYVIAPKEKTVQAWQMIYGLT